jgi:glutamate-5-semialdehyde dehydrogenase
MSLEKDIQCLAKAAQDASRTLAWVSTQKKNTALEKIAQRLLSSKKILFAANQKDLLLATRKGCSSAFLDRLTLTDSRIREMSDSLQQVARLKDLVGDVIRMWRRPNGLMIGKMRVPFGVVAIIYESRPNVTSDCAGLCLKSGNSVILRGGSEAWHSNQAIYRIIQEVLKSVNLPKACVSMLASSDRKALKFLLKQDKYCDLVIPRGGEELIRFVAKNSKIPVIKHYKGICHIYVDKSADIAMAIKVTVNAKVQRPGVCNAVETLLVHKDIAAKFLPEAANALRRENVELRGCPRVRRLVKGVRLATEKDWRTEYLALILSIRVVDNLDAAIAHVNYYGSKHSDAIITNDYKSAVKFLKEVDSACVYVNTSTRFTDGYQFGLGAEIGISTDKIHARGPMALEELLTYKYVIFGNGQIRS